MAATRNLSKRQKTIKVETPKIMPDEKPKLCVVFMTFAHPYKAAVRKNGYLSFEIEKLTMPVSLVIGG